MGMTITEAMAAVGAPGAPFEVITVEHGGVVNRQFKNAPANLRDFFDLARGSDAHRRGGGLLRERWPNVYRIVMWAWL